MSITTMDDRRWVQLLSPWEVDGVIDRFKELHGIKPPPSFTEMAAMLSGEFKVTISRNAAIGKAARLGLPRREGTNPGFSHYNAARKRARLEAGPRIRVRKAIVPAIAPAESVIPLHISFDELMTNSCRYPYGDGPFTFCGCPAASGRSYCAPHYALTNNRNHLMSSTQWKIHQRKHKSKFQAEVVSA